MKFADAQIYKIVSIFVLIFISLSSHAYSQSTDTISFESASDKQLNVSSRFAVPPGHEPGFKISNQYPPQLPSATQPWMQIDFKTEPRKYMKVLLDYIIEGNLDVDWQVGENQVRKWYHAPWMHFGGRGREPIHGMTRERGSRPFELHELQTDRTNNWAVGFYNSLGGYTIGKIWSDPTKPDTIDVSFPVGTVSAKLLFTDAKVEQVPFLKDSKIWYGQISRGQAPVKMRLLQLDIAVRDSRADNETGWLFGTFMYHADSIGNSTWEKLIPVGIHWGNDPNRVEADFNLNKPLEEGWMNPEVEKMFSNLPRKWLGLWGRVNGPVDNSMSSCLACHSRAMDLGESNKFPPFAPNPNNAAEVLNYFKNRKPNEPFFAGFRSLDYSLQLADGVANFREWVRQDYPEHIDNIYNDNIEAMTNATQLQLKSLNNRTTVTEDLAKFLAKEAYESPFSRDD